ncbi:MAG: PTS mannitol transporter subunit IICBA [Acidobacteriota bacterium]|nr:PTS mannitol transporter subunit IICBA [Acidobacteriota bacterium]
MADVRAGVAKFGKFLSGMVMPNIGAFIAWGFLTAFFIETGWRPNAQLAEMVSPVLKYLIPVMIAGQGGQALAGQRGRVIGSIAVMGAIVGSEYTMLMGAMLMGPLAGLIIRRWDDWSATWKPAGLEMLVDNFSLGILGMLLAIVGYYGVGPFMGGILVVLQVGVETLVNARLLPLLSVFIEPAKVLFLNNAIGNGVFVPIATEQAKTAGQSIMYMLESNPGPGLGVLLAYALFCRDESTRQSAPGAIIIHFLGGIHEIYFPYVLMNPKVIVAPIAGNLVSILWFSMTGCGLVGPASPGSIIAFLAMAPGAKMIMILLGVLIGAAVSFAIASPIVRSTEVADLASAQSAVADMKAGEPSGDAKAGFGDKIIFACDAGMGSSAMGATRFRNRIKLDRPDLIVEHASVDEVPADTRVVVVQANLAERARRSAPQAQFVVINNFLSDPNLDSLYNSLVATAAAAGVGETDEETLTKKVEDPTTPNIAIDRAGIRLNCPSISKEEAIRASGELLMAHDAVDAGYIDAMLERERVQSVYMGMGVAIPHGTNQAKESVKKTCVTLHQYPNGIDWGEEKAYLVFGIAGVGGEHLQVLANVARALEDEDVVERMRTTDDIDWLLRVLS